MDAITGWLLADAVVVATSSTVVTPPLQRCTPRHQSPRPQRGAVAPSMNHGERPGPSSPAAAASEAPATPASLPPSSLACVLRHVAATYRRETWGPNSAGLLLREQEAGGGRWPTMGQRMGAGAAL
ncbi:hypothetical protein C2845_PM05G14270 [Panicum miliaceum]|uniref:Uncharacterized protein n=1 Tax=Panicum miliaceum TaxID=4540 RepID=A0A3L6T2W3_PANMI|nr:hypothetical protein C2845_PM05G14270 [Panicum miliaceum]